MTDTTEEETRLINHDLAPQAHDKPVLFKDIAELDQAIDYALGGFHVCVDKVEKDGRNADKWNLAGWAYFTAYSSVVGLRGVEGDHVPMARDLLATANDAADVAQGKKPKKKD